MPPKDPQYASGVEQRPELDRHFQAGTSGLHVIGGANGSPLLKTCINEGVEVIRSISRLMPPSRDAGTETEILIVGAGPAGLSAALEARRRGYRFEIVEQGRPLNTILNFPDGKQVYAEPAKLQTLGQLELEDALKEDLLERWSVQAGELDIHRAVNVREIRRRGSVFEVRAADGQVFTARRVILAIGRMGNPRKLGAPGEDLPCVYTALHNPGKYVGQGIVVVGGGNSAAEAALALSAQNRVTLVHRDDGLPRVSRANRTALERAQANGTLRVMLSANAKAFRDTEVDVSVDGEIETLKVDVAFVLIGADPPTAFLKRLGVTFEGQWRWSRLAPLAWVFALIYSLYAIKSGRWPYAGTYAQLMAWGADPSLLYGILYSGLMTFFGLRAARRYRHDSYQRKRYGTLISAQWLIYFILPWALYYAGHSDYWRWWGVTLTYPLGYYGLWDSANQLFAGTALPWALATLVAFLVVVPLVSAFHGKRFCAWVCPCGGLADTVGDAWRAKAPRGKTVRKLEGASTIILLLTVACSVFLISGYRALADPGTVKEVYRLMVDFGLASVIAITLYPFNGPRIWCRFFCPLAKWMELWGRWTGGRLAIVPNSECISCGECTRYCQMGIDVRAFAVREQRLSNRTTGCVFCGICVTVCPVDVLRVERRGSM